MREGSELTTGPLGIGHFVNLIRQTIKQDRLFQNQAIKGEVSQWKQYPSGHTYFTLRDNDGQMSAVIWRGRCDIDAKIKEGSEVIVIASVDLYAKQGRVQLIVDKIEPINAIGGMEETLRKLKIKLNKEGVFELPKKPDLFAEGGEFYLCKKENILFAGNSRNSMSGIEAVAKFLGVTDLIILKSNVFHLDAYFCPVISREGEICAITCCIEELSKNSKVQLYKFADSKNIPIIRLPNIDGIGSKKNLGSFAVNALPIPGFLIGPKPYSNKNVLEKLNEIGIERINTPMSQYALSGGSVHCCTNEIY